MNQVKIGNFIQQCRKQKDLTQEQLGEKLGVTSKAVSKWENARSLPDPALYEDLCNILDISLTELFHGDYIKTEELKAKTDEILLDQMKSNKKNNIIQILCSIMQGIGVALLFVPIYKSFDEAVSTIIVITGLALFVVGLGIKIR